MKIKNLLIICLSIFPLLSIEFIGIKIALILSLNVLLLFINKKPIRYISILLNFLTFYFLKEEFGRLYLPEPMIIFLAISVLTKIHFSKKDNNATDRLLSIVWIACFSLLKTDLTYFFVMIYSISFILATFQDEDNKKINPFLFVKLDRVGGFETLLSIFIIVIMFIFFPRYNGFLPKRNSVQIGKIGYSNTIDNSQVVNLSQSSQIAFTAQTDQQINNNLLYWRGRTHSITDGFNWRSGHTLPTSSKVTLNTPILYKVKLEQDLGDDLILLDTPFKVEKSNLNYYKDKTTNEYHIYQKGKKGTYNAISSLNGKQKELSNRNRENYTKLPGFIPASLNNIVNKLNLKGKDLKFVLRKIKGYLITNKFSYSLSPGDVTTLGKFLKNKIGYCTHYASFLGVLLRHLGFQTRLVSGFQGGVYNELGGYYTVRSNDSHAWVEVLNQGVWTRVDPTGFIDPARIRLGGQTYFNSEDQNQIQANNKGIFRNIAMTWNFINYKLSLFLDNYDLEEQNNLSIKLNIKKKTFYILGLFLLIIFCLFYLFKPSKEKGKMDPADKLFYLFIKKMNSKGVEISRNDSLALIKSSIPKYVQAIHFVELYEKIRYSNDYSAEDFKNLKRLGKTKSTYQPK